mgnify:CR=1 FL=1
MLSAPGSGTLTCLRCQEIVIAVSVLVVRRWLAKRINLLGISFKELSLACHFGSVLRTIGLTGLNSVNCIFDGKDSGG